MIKGDPDAEMKLGTASKKRPEVLRDFRPSERHLKFPLRLRLVFSAKLSAQTN